MTPGLSFRYGKRPGCRRYCRNSTTPSMSLVAVPFTTQWLPTVFPREKQTPWVIYVPPQREIGRKSRWHLHGRRGGGVFLLQSGEAETEMRFFAVYCDSRNFW